MPPRLGGRPGRRRQDTARRPGRHPLGGGGPGTGARTPPSDAEPAVAPAVLPPGSDRRGARILLRSRGGVTRGRRTCSRWSPRIRSRSAAIRCWRGSARAVWARSTCRVPRRAARWRSRRSAPTSPPPRTSRRVSPGRYAPATASGPRGPSRWWTSARPATARSGWPPSTSPHPPSPTGSPPTVRCRPPPCACWPVSSPPRWPPYTPAASRTGTSNRPTSSSAGPGPCSSTSVSPVPPTTPGTPAPAVSSAPRVPGPRAGRAGGRHRGG